MRLIWLEAVSFSWLTTHRFAALCVAVWLAMAFGRPATLFGGDFWQHAAAVRELAVHPADPGHPELHLDAPSPFFTPYTLGAAMVSRAVHADAVTVLTALGLVNLALLFVGLYVFIWSLPPQHRDTAPFYALLLTLFWWGADPWPYSGFFHIGVLGYVMPYPSTFAVALTLIALGMNQRRLETQHQWWLVPIFAIAATVLLSHPITLLLLAAGLGSQALASRRALVVEMVRIGGLLALVFAIATFWPYLPAARRCWRSTPTSSTPATATCMSTCCRACGPRSSPCPG